MLKDILAFANAWRENDAHILRGVREVTGGKAEVVGVEQHFDDADLQQFVNGKTNKHVNFGYETYAHEDKQVGIFTIRRQERPIYLRNDFGSLRRNTVYVRRGSSAAEATVEEAADMAKSSVPAVPVLELQFFSRPREWSKNSADVQLLIIMGLVSGPLHVVSAYEEDIPALEACHDP